MGNHYGLGPPATFLGLEDTPATYAGKPLKVARVKQAADGMEFADAITQYEIPTNIVPDQVNIEYTTATYGNFVKRIRVFGKYLVWVEQSAAEGRARIMDVSNPEAPELLYTFDAGGDYYQDLAISGNYMFIASGIGNKIFCIDWSNPRSWTVLKTFTHAKIDNPTALAVRGRYLYVLSFDDSALVIFDISDPANPVYVGDLTNLTYLQYSLDLVISGNQCFVIGLPYLTAINIADPTNPTRTSSLSVNKDGGSFTGRMCKAGKYIYVADFNNDRLRIVNVVNPASMSIVGTLTDATNLDGINDVRVVGDWVFCAAYESNKMVIVDARTIGTPTVHETYDMSYCGAIEIAGKYCFLMSSGRATDTGLHIISVWSIDIPAFIGNSIYADYIFCENLDVSELLNAAHGLFSGVGVPEGLPKTMAIPLVLAQVSATAPGVAYTELSALYRTNIDLSKLSVKQTRVIVSAIGNEEGAGKGIEIYNSTDAAAICEVTWDGNTQQNGLAGAWATCSLRAAKDIQVRVKASSVTEDITVDKVELQLLFE